MTWPTCLVLLSGSFCLPLTDNLQHVLILKLLFFWTTCNFSSYYRVFNYLNYRYTLRWKQMYLNFRRFWVLYLRHLQRMFSNSLSNVPGFCWFLLYLFSSHTFVALLCSIYKLCYLKHLVQHSFTVNSIRLFPKSTNSL